MVVVVDVVVVVVLVLVVVVVLVDVVLGGIVVSDGTSEVVVVVEVSGVLIVVVVSVPSAGGEGCVSAASLAAILADVSEDVAAGCVEATLASSVLFVLLEHPDNESAATIAVARIDFICISPYGVLWCGIIGGLYTMVTVVLGVWGWFWVGAGGWFWVF